METIRQNEKIILHSNDRNFQDQEYVEYIRHIAIRDMGFSPGIIEHCKDDEVIGKGTIPNV